MDYSLLVIAAVIGRVIPHLPNFAPIGGLALYSGTQNSLKKAWIIPVCAMIISDLIVGFDSLTMRAAVYGSFGIITLVGKFVARKHNAGNLILASVLASLIFFTITNFAVWATGSMYPKNLTGLVQCFVMALPFLRNTAMGDLFYTGVFFGASALARNYPTFITSLPQRLQVVIMVLSR